MHVDSVKFFFFVKHQKTINDTGGGCVWDGGYIGGTWKSHTTIGALDSLVLVCRHVIHVCDAFVWHGRDVSWGDMTVDEVQ